MASATSLGFARDGTMFVAQPQLLQTFDTQGRLLYACRQTLAGDYFTTVAVDGNHLFLAGSSGLYRSSLTRTRPAHCRTSPIRIGRVSLVHTATRDVLRVSVKGRFKLSAAIWPEQHFACASRGFATGSPTQTECVQAVPGTRVTLSRTVVSGRHDLAIPGCRRIRTCLGDTPVQIATRGERGEFLVTRRYAVGPRGRA